jgi:hypothetical protein
MSSLRWLGALAGLALFAVGPAEATDPSLGGPEVGALDPTVTLEEAPAVDSTKVEAAAAATLDPMTVTDESSVTGETPLGDETPVSGGTEEPSTLDPPPQVRGASIGGSPQRALETVTGALGKQTPPAGPAEQGEGPIGAVPSMKESLQVGDALDDMLLFPEPYYYQSLGRRDIFLSLLEEEEGGDPNLKSGELTVVGILWAEKVRFALVETPDGRALILREGSALGDGTVVRILPDRVIVHVTEFGTSRNVSLPLAQGGLNDENPRSRSR